MVLMQQKGTGMAGEFQQELDWHSREITKCGPVSEPKLGHVQVVPASFLYIIVAKPLQQLGQASDSCRILR